MTLDDIKARIAVLVSEISKHQKLYYELDAPVISDFAYDAMFRELQDLEIANPSLKVKNSPTDKVGGAVSSDLTSVKHLHPMLSLANSLDLVEAQEWEKTTRRELALSPKDPLMLTGEPKYDGLSCALVFLYGQLDQGVTRGDGEAGEDVTAQVKTVGNIPHNIPELSKVARYEIRGEILMLKSSFKSLNERQAAAGSKLFVNPRNAAAGALRNSNPEITRERGLHFFAYCLGKCSDDVEFGFDTQVAMLEKFRSFGFTTGDVVLIDSSKIGEHFDTMAAMRSSLPYEIDGIVFKVNDLDVQDQLGWKSRTPNWATAFKFPPDRSETILEAIDIQVGRTGAQTPVARLRPVSCGGVTVTNATLHNAEEIARQDFRVGDTVIVVRNGDVIPGIAEVVHSKRPTNAVPFVMPHVCASCGGPVVKEQDKAGTFCHAGLKCPAQRLGAISHFVGRKTMDIDGLGESTIAALLDAGLISTMSDLYSLKQEDILAIPGFGKRSAELLVNGVHAIKNPELRKFIYALGMPNTGEGTSKRLAAHFGSFQKLKAASYKEILSITDIGPTTADSVYEYLHDSVTGAEADKLFAILQPKDEIAIDTSALKLGGKTFVVTGTLSVKREDIHALIEANGGLISGSVNKKLNYLVAGDAAGSKLEKAQASGVTVLTEAEFRAMIA